MTVRCLKHPVRSPLALIGDPAPLIVPAVLLRLGTELVENVRSAYGRVVEAFRHFIEEPPNLPAHRQGAGDDEDGDQPP